MAGGEAELDDDALLDIVTLEVLAVGLGTGQPAEP